MLCDIPRGNIYNFAELPFLRLWYICEHVFRPRPCHEASQRLALELFTKQVSILWSYRTFLSTFFALGLAVGHPRHSRYKSHCNYYSGASRITNTNSLNDPFLGHGSTRITHNILESTLDRTQCDLFDNKRWLGLAKIGSASLHFPFAYPSLDNSFPGRDGI